MMDLLKLLQISKKLLSCSVILILSFSLWACAPMEHLNKKVTIRSKPAPVTKITAPSPHVELTLEENHTLQQSPSQVMVEVPLSEIVEEDMTVPEPEETVAQEALDLERLGDWQQEITPPAPKAKEVVYDFPVTINRQVQYYLDIFQNQQRASFGRWLTRSGRYVPLIQERLKQAGLPLDLAYLPMIESGYSLTAFSKAKAVGPWQFMRTTAIHFGLKVDNYVDERRDPVKSTDAAIAYLKKLHEEFDSWELAVAGYNAGEGKIRRAIKKYKTENFWKIAEYKYLRAETKLYVPKLIAAIIIAKSPEKYGFTNIEYHSPLQFDYAQVPSWTPLKAISLALGKDLDEIRNLNRELRKQITPPDSQVYTIKIPKECKDLLAKNLPRVKTTVSNGFKTHVVKKGDTLNAICRTYNLNKITLLKANNLSKGKMTPGKRLRIPYRITEYRLMSDTELAAVKKSTGNRSLTQHTIRPGESISSISKKYGVTQAQIAIWNGLRDINKIRAGQQLALYIGQPVAQITQPTAALRPDKTKSKTESSGITILTGNKKQPASQAIAQNYYYRVQGGDSLWKIARRFNLRTRDIMEWNNLKDNTIHPGLTLLLKRDA